MDTSQIAEAIRKWATPALLALILLFGTNIARAAEHAQRPPAQPAGTGWYVGAGLGIVDTECEESSSQGFRREYEGYGRPSVSSDSCNDGISHRLYIGDETLFGIGSDRLKLGLELGYTDIEVVDSLSAELLLRGYLNPTWNVLVGYGVHYYEEDGGDSDPVYGVGIEAAPWANWRFRLQGRRFEVGSTDQDEISLSVSRSIPW